MRRDPALDLACRRLPAASADKARPGLPGGARMRRELAFGLGSRRVPAGSAHPEVSG